MAWSVSRFFEAVEACTTYASYPHASKRARGSLGGRNMVGHGLDCFEAVHVLSRLPVRPWTKQMSIVESGQSRHTLMPSGNRGGGSDVVGLGASESDGGRKVDEVASLLVRGSLTSRSAHGGALLPTLKTSLSRRI